MQSSNIFTIAKYLGEIEITINCPSVSLQQTGIEKEFALLKLRLYN